MLSKETCEREKDCFWSTNHSSCKIRPKGIFEAHTDHQLNPYKNNLKTILRRILHVDIAKWSREMTDNTFVFPWVIHTPSYALDAVLACDTIQRPPMSKKPKEDTVMHAREYLEYHPYLFAVVHLNVSSTNTPSGPIVQTPTLGFPPNHNISMFMYRRTADDPWRAVCSDPNYSHIENAKKKTANEHHCREIIKVLTGKDPQKFKHMQCFNSNAFCNDFNARGICFTGTCATLLAALLIKEDPAKNGLELMQRIIKGNNQARVQGSAFLAAALQQVDRNSIWPIRPSHPTSPLGVNPASSASRSRSRSPRNASSASRSRPRLPEASSWR